MKQRALWPAVVLAALVLAGCGKATGTGTSGTSDKLVVWDWKSSDKAAANFVAKAKADFVKKHPGVTVEFVAQPFDNYYTLLGAAIQAGKGPDVILLTGAARFEAAMLWVVIDAAVSVTLTRAQADPGRGLSRDPQFHHRAHRRFRQLLPTIPADLTFDSQALDAEQIAAAITNTLEV